MVAATYWALFLLMVLLALGGNPAQQHWALSGLTTLLSTLLGLLAGRKL